MEFNFDIRKYFTTSIEKIDHSLIPAHFHGDKRELNLCYQHMSKIIDKLGMASAEAQGLQKPITSALKLQHSEHSLYLLTDTRRECKGNGVVVGLLKMGWKNLYLFDKVGKCIQKNTLCVLDFYVHESRQRMGCGMKLFEFMLSDMHVAASNLAIDKPSQKFLCFLSKHYGLQQIVPQNNNFVVFNTFFGDTCEDSNNDTPWSSCKNNSENFISKHSRVHTQLW